METKKITIAICTNRQIRAKTLESLLKIVAQGGFDFHIVVANEGYSTAENRIYCVSQARKNESDYIFFVDDDMTMPSETLQALLAHGKEVVGANYYSRTLPLQTVIGFLPSDEITTEAPVMPTELFKVRYAGTGCMLIDLKVFDKIEKPWFYIDTFEFGMTKMSDDVWFCSQCEKAGIDIWCDPQIQVGHLGDYNFIK
jgi:hypothetical protein